MMKVKFIWIILSFIFCVSCNRKERSNICDKLFAYNLYDTCSLWEINPTSNYVISYTDEYYIWKKYGVVIGNRSVVRSPREDSCFFVKSKQFYIQKYGVQIIESLGREVDSILNESKLDYFYFDSVLCTLPPFDTINSEAKIVDKNRYNRLIDSLGKAFTSSKFITLEYWYLIDTMGNLENVELINCSCSEVNQKKIVETLRVLHWKPAIYLGKKVKWRGKDFICIKAK